MSRKREPLSLSLFPFLAVLICTMGVLVALLLLVVKRAEQSTDEQDLVAAAEFQQQLAEVELALAEAELRNRLLESRREEARQRLGQQRGLLGHLDNELNALREHAQVLAEQILALRSPAAEGNERGDVEQQVLTQQATLVALERQIEAEKAALTDEGLEPSSGRAAVYSIVPIAAQSGTNRRPIYIECREEGLYLHPGNIPLTLADFVLPLTPGNPLDAALLAYREYWRRALGSGAGGGNAYPLMVVRPSGAKWYGVARRAMSGWDQEFGYELIPEEWEVNFGAADAGLVASVQQAIDSSIVRQQSLIAYGQATPASYQASAGAGDSRGGANRGVTPAADGGFSAATHNLSERRARGGAANAANGADPIAAFSSQFHETRGAGVGPAGAVGSAGAEPSNSTSSSLWSSSRQTPSAASLVTAASHSAPSEGENLRATGGESRASTDDRPAGAAGPRRSATERGMTTANRTATANGSAANGSAANGSAANGSVANGSVAERQAKSSGAGTSGPVSAAAGGSSSSRNGERSSGGAAGMSSTMGTVSAAGQSQPPTVAEVSRGADAAAEWNPQALAHQRGGDWALPSRRNAVSAYHRPIQVRVTPSALILAAGEGSSQAETLPVETSLAAAIDPLANAIWRRVDRWGYLGFDGYWKPVLHLQYAPEQRVRALELERLLEGSGLEVQHPVGQSAGGKR